MDSLTLIIDDINLGCIWLKVNSVITCVECNKECVDWEVHHGVIGDIDGHICRETA